MIAITINKNKIIIICISIYVYVDCVYVYCARVIRLWLVGHAIYVLRYTIQHHCLQLIAYMCKYIVLIYFADIDWLMLIYLVICCALLIHNK